MHSVNPSVLHSERFWKIEGEESIKVEGGRKVGPGSYRCSLTLLVFWIDYILPFRRLLQVAERPEHERGFRFIDRLHQEILHFVELDWYRVGQCGDELFIHLI